MSKTLNFALATFVTIFSFTGYILLVALGLERIYLVVFYVLYFLAVLLAAVNLFLAFYYAKGPPAEECKV